MTYPMGRGGAGKRRDEALLCLIYFAGGENYQLAPRETYEPLAEFFNLSEEEPIRPIGDNDNRSKWENLIQTSRERLRKKGYLDGSRREVWRLTSEGIDRAVQIERDYDELKNILRGAPGTRPRVSPVTPEPNKVVPETVTILQDERLCINPQMKISGFESAHARYLDYHRRNVFINA